MSPKDRYVGMTREGLEFYADTLHAAYSSARVLLARAAIDADEETLQTWQAICEKVDEADAFVEALRFLSE